MDNYITGKTIRKLREKNNLTQSELAQILSVTGKTISKWETGRGLPDITLIEPLANALFVSVAELMAGEQIINRNKSANMIKSNFYVCPICGNVLWSIGGSVVSCCGVSLPKIESEQHDENHQIKIEKVENEYFVSIDHPMTKNHFISFIGFIGYDRVEIVKLYPESPAEARFFCRGGGEFVVFCNRHGLFHLKIR